jgi:hypothetical protein
LASALVASVHAVETSSDLPVQNGIHSFYAASNYANGILPDTSGNGRDATLVTGTVTKSRSKLGYSGADLDRISGTTSSQMEWPSNSIPGTFTICSMTRYEGSVRERILTAKSVNWLHGHWQHSVGVAFYQGWTTGSVRSLGYSQLAWAVMCGRNKDSSLILLNSRSIDTNVHVSSQRGGVTLTINGGYNGEKSDWGLAYVAIWDRHLSDTELRTMDAFFMEKISTTRGAGFDEESFDTDVEIVQGNFGDPLINGKIQVDCPDGYAVTGCTCYSAWYECKGAYPSYDLASCVVEGPHGRVQPRATCVKNMGDTKGVVVFSDNSFDQDDKTGWVECPTGYAMAGCGYMSNGKASTIDGVDTQNANGRLRCMARDGISNDGIVPRAVATCFKGMHSSQPTVAESPNYAARSDDARNSVACPAGSIITSCQCHTIYRNCDGALPGYDWCRSQTSGIQSSSGTKAMAICVDFHRHPTSAPTPPPTSAPTSAPTTQGFFEAAQLTDALSKGSWQTGRLGTDVYKCDHVQDVCFVNSKGSRGSWTLVQGVPPTNMGINLDFTIDGGDGDGANFAIDLDGITITLGEVEMHHPWKCSCA